MSEVQLDVDKKYEIKPNIKRLELEYKDMNYIIFNLDEKVIDINGDLYEVIFNKRKELEDLVWSYELIDEYDYLKEDESLDETLWRISWYDENDNYYHKRGVTKYPDYFKVIVKMLKELGRN